LQACYRNFFMQPRLPWRLLAALFLLTLFLAPLPGIAGPFWRVLEDTAHVLLFAALMPVLALWLSGTGLLAGRSLPTVNACAWGLAVTLGLAIEILQSLTGRDASWSDLRADALGAAAGLLALTAWRQRKHRRGTGWLAAASLALLVSGCWPLWQQLATQLEARRAMPVLLGDATPRALLNIEQRSATIQRTSPHWRIQFQDGLPWPGITFEGWPRDWRNHHALVLDLQNPDNTAFLLAAQEHRVVTLPLEEVARTPGGRQLDLGAIRSVSIFRTQGTGRSLLVREVRLN
jgi:VanZ family protein